MGPRRPSPRLVPLEAGELIAVRGRLAAPRLEVARLILISGQFRAREPELGVELGEVCPVSIMVTREPDRQMRA